MEKFLVPLFDGSEDPESWLQSMEDYFEDFHILMEDYVKICIGNLRGAAAIWAMENELIISRNWCAFCYNLLWKFAPSSKVFEEEESILDGNDNHPVEVLVPCHSEDEIDFTTYESESIDVTDASEEKGSEFVEDETTNEEDIESAKSFATTSSTESVDAICTEFGNIKSGAEDMEGMQENNTTNSQPSPLADEKVATMSDNSCANFYSVSLFTPSVGQSYSSESNSYGMSPTGLFQSDFSIHCNWFHMVYQLIYGGVCVCGRETVGFEFLEKGVVHTQRVFDEMPKRQFTRSSDRLLKEMYQEDVIMLQIRIPKQMIRPSLPLETRQRIGWKPGDKLQAFLEKYFALAIGWTDREHYLEDKMEFKVHIDLWIKVAWYLILGVRCLLVKQDAPPFHCIIMVVGAKLGSDKGMFQKTLQEIRLRNINQKCLQQGFTLGYLVQLALGRRKKFQNLSHYYATNPDPFRHKLSCFILVHYMGGQTDIATLKHYKLLADLVTIPVMISVHIVYGKLSAGNIRYTVVFYSLWVNADFRMLLEVVIPSEKYHHSAGLITITVIPSVINQIIGWTLSIANIRGLAAVSRGWEANETCLEFC